MVFCAAAAALAWWYLRPAPGAKPARPLPVRMAKARSGSLQQILRVTGVTSTDRFQVLLAPTMPGSRTGRSYLEFMLVLQSVVKPGTWVKKGEVVAEFDRQYMLNRLEDYKSWVTLHELNLDRLRALLTVTRAGHDQLVLRAKGLMEKTALDLKKIPILSTIKAERARLDAEESAARYREAAGRTKWVMASEMAAIRRSELDLRQTRMEFDRAKRNIDRMLVKAPIDGMTVMLTAYRNYESVQIQQGDQVGSGEPYMRIVDNSSMVVTAAVNQVDSEEVRVGMEATVHFDAFPDLELPARVTAVGMMAQSRGLRANWVRSVPIRLKLEDADPRVIPDLSVSADLVVDSVDDSVVVPRECVFSSGQETYAWVQSQGGWEKRAVETGLASNTEVSVRSGLHAGDTLASENPR